jgi:RNA polymerase sigma-70 factor (ECF subfamily)
MDRTDVSHNPHQSAAPLELASRESDELLARRAASDPSAFAELYIRYVVRIDRYCSRRLHDRDLAQDATSQVFLKALESLRRQRIDNVASWLFSIAHNEVIDRYRRQRHDTHIDRVPNLASRDRSPEEEALALIAASDLRALLPRLSADQQRVIELRLAGLTTSEIQDVLGKGRSWVCITGYRALHRLRDLLDAPATGKGS